MSEKLAAEIRSVNVHAIAYVSPNGLESLSTLLKQAELVVSVNTGVMHLAAILGAPTIALNGPTATHRWGPIGPRATSVEPFDGTGGFLHFGFEFRGNPRDTMSRIRVTDVVKAAQKVSPGLVVDTEFVPSFSAPPNLLLDLEFPL